MALATWWYGDPTPLLPPITNFYAGPSGDAALLARLTQLDVESIQARIGDAHVPYVAWLDDNPVAYGWAATQTAHVGELDLHIALPRRGRYLWDFKTLPAWRGRGIYPHLLQTILAAEATYADRFWIIAAPENRASAAGIAKAGFQTVANLSFQHDGQPRLIPVDSGSRIRAAEDLLKTPLLKADELTAPCWHCVIKAQQAGATMTAVSCWESRAFDALAHSVCSCGQASKAWPATDVRVL